MRSTVSPSRLDPDHYLTTEEGATLARKPSREAFLVWAKRRGLRARGGGKGGRCLFVRREVELLLEGKRFPGDVNHGVTVAAARSGRHGNAAPASSEEAR